MDDERHCFHGPGVTCSVCEPIIREHSKPDGHRGPWRRARALRSPFESRVVLVGDRIRFSTALLGQMAETEQLVTVERIVREVDGTLTLHLRRSSSSSDG